MRGWHQSCFEQFFIMNKCVWKANKMANCHSFVVSRPLARGLWEHDQPIISIPHVFLHLVTNFQLSRTTPWGILNIGNTSFGTSSFPYIMGSNQMCDVTSVVSYLHPMIILYKRVNVVTSEVCENPKKTYMEMCNVMSYVISFTH